jgi:hypothetical protein
MYLVTSGTAPEQPADPARQAGPRHARSPWSRTDTTGVPRAGQPGHGVTASLRRQPVRIVNGQAEGGYTDMFEVVCPDCGDHPGLDYSEVTTRLQWLRGPRPLEAGLAEYERHLGLIT